jgi:hypothetical protein
MDGFSPRTAPFNLRDVVDVCFISFTHKRVDNVNLNGDVCEPDRSIPEEQKNNHESNYIREQL